MEMEGNCLIRPRREFAAGGFRLVFLSVVIMLMGRPLESETLSECKGRIEALIDEESLVKESDDRFFIPTRIIQSHPVFLRNMIATLLSRPQLSIFWGGFERQGLTLHHMKSGYEWYSFLARLDAAGQYSLEEFRSFLLAHGMSKQEGFDLDFSQLSTNGLALGFMDPPAQKLNESERKLRRKFVEFFVRSLLKQSSLVSVQRLSYLNFSGGFVIEDAFFADQVHSAMKDFLVDQLQVESLQPYNDYFQKRFKAATYQGKGKVESDLNLDIRFRRLLADDSDKAIYEVSWSSKLEGDLSINGSVVEWFEKDGNRFGLVILDRNLDSKELIVEFSTLAGLEIIRLKA